MKKCLTRILASLLVFCMGVTLIPQSVLAVQTNYTVSTQTGGSHLSKNDEITGTPYYVTSLKKYGIAPDVNEKIIVTNNKEGNSQTVANVMEVNPNNGNAKIVAGYGKLNPSQEGWTLERMSNQAHQYENKFGLNVVGGVNASLFNITNGEPMGVLVMSGKVHKGDTGMPYIAVFSDGSAGIFYGGTSLESAEQQQSAKQGKNVTLVDAIAGWHVLVDGDKVGKDGSNPGYYARTAVGLKADGTIVMLQADGTQAPRSLGYTIEEMGYMMKSLGCVIALELDEGGSSTYISQREGEDDLSLRNTPAGGAERYISTSILVVSTAAASGEFDHASITPDSEFYTPNTKVTFNATGIDFSGALANEIPATITWKLADESFGTLENATLEGNNATVEFTSNGKLGDATIYMMNGEKTVGEVTVHIQNPDQIKFGSDEVNLKYSQVTDLGLTALYQGAPVNLKVGDITWSIEDPTAGSFEGNNFVVTSDKQVSVTTNITATYGELSDTTTVNVGKQPTVILDGGDTDVWNYANIGNTVTSFAGLASDEVATYFYNKGAIIKGSVISDTDEEYADIVRFGTKAIKLDFDFSNTTGTDGACLGTGSILDIPGAPTALGVWVYIPENTPVPWLRAQIQTSATGDSWTNAYIDFTTQQDTGEETVAGWQYIEADLSAYSGQMIRINSGMLFRAMITQAGIGWYTTEGVKVDKSALKGYIILDNVQIVYGANSQDVTNPKVNNVQLINDNGTKTELENGTVLNSNSLNFFVSYDDNEATDEFATGIESAYFYFDGNYYGEGERDNLGSTLTGLELANGEHSITFYLKDGFGNVTRETRYFTVNNKDTYTNVSLNAEKDPFVGKDYVLTLDSNNAANISSVETTISIPETYTVKSVEFAAGFTGTYSYNKNKKQLTISATSDKTQTGNTIATITLDVPADTVEGTNINLGITKGSYEVYDASCAVKEENWAKGFSAQNKLTAIKSDYLVNAETLIVGQPGVLSVTANGEPKEGVNVYLSDGTLLGTTSEQGEVITFALTEVVGQYTIYAMDEEENRSYYVTVTSFTSTGDAAGAPYHISMNMATDLTTEKNISWMSHPTFSTENAQIKFSTTEDMANATTVMGESNLVTYSGSKLVNRANSVYLKGLKSDTTYYYQVGDGSVWSEVKSFTTKPANDSTTDFFILADIQESGALEGFKRMAQYLNDGKFDFGIQTGDAVDNVRYYNQWDDALSLFELVPDYNVLHVIGNHEDDDDNQNSIATKNIFNILGDWYSVEYGDVYVAVLGHVTSEAELKQFKEWLVADAAKTDCTWKVVTTHIPVYTTNPGGANKAYMSVVADAMEEAGIDFYFAGDAHSYARTAPVTDLTVDEENGVVYYICGSTGGKSYSAVDNPEYHFEVATIDFESIYMAVSADFDSIEVTAYNIDSSGNRTILDTYRKDIPYCENDEHAYIYDRETDTLTCPDCPSVIKAKEALYSGFATESVSGKNMYFISGSHVTGYVQLETNSYFFDDNGLGYEGEFKLSDETVYFEDGLFSHSDNENVITAGWCGDNAYYIIYADGTIKIDGTGTMNTTSRDNVQWQVYRAFIKKVVFGAGITEVSDYAFYDCDALTTIEFEKGSKMTVIGGAAFFSCNVLQNVVLPDSVTTIYGNAFAQCPVLKDVYLPDGVSYMSSQSFTKSPNVVLSVALNSYASEFAKKNNIAYVERERVVLGTGTCGEKLTWTLTSDGVLEITGTGAMTSYTSGKAPWYKHKDVIKTVKVPAGATTIGDNAFADCHNLEKVEIAEGSKLTTIGGSAFYGCASLYEIVLPEGVTTIYGNAFANCTGLKSAYLPDGVKQISSSSFKNTKVVLNVKADSYAYEYAVKNNLEVIQRFPSEIDSIKLDKTTATLNKGETVELNATVVPENTTADKTVTWSTSDEKVATVENGKVTAVGVGTATITVTASDGKTATCKVTVLSPLTNITLNKTTATMNRGESLTLEVTMIPEDTTTDKTLTWTTSNEKVATVENGKVKAVGVGSATITVTASNGLTATCKVTVVAPIESVTLNKTEVTVNKGETVQLEATIVPADTTDSKVVTWTTSDESVATVDANGKVTAVGKGAAVITVTTANGVTAKCTVTVGVELPYSDVNVKKWYYPWVVEAYDLGLMTGLNETTFAPNETMTRGMVAHVLYRIAGEPETEYVQIFPDMNTKKYCALSVTWAYQNGIVGGYTTGDAAGKFGPNDNILRQDLVVMLYRYAQQLGIDTTNDVDLTSYVDHKEVSKYAQDAMEWANSVGILTGTLEGELLPKENATRAECAKMLVTFTKLVNEK